jgi:hypothetical protein
VELDLHYMTPPHLIILMVEATLKLYARVTKSVHGAGR